MTAMSTARQGQPLGGPAEPLLQVTALNVQLAAGGRQLVQAVEDVSFTIQAGDKVGLVGESGSGKSVSGKAITGLLPESKRTTVSGSIRFHGQEGVGGGARFWDPVRRTRASMIFQDPLSSLNPVMKVGKQVRESLNGASGYTVNDYLRMAGFPAPEQVSGMYPFQLSGGMRQRVMIALGLAKQPELIVADEPTTALDVTVQRTVLATLQRCVEETGAALLLITHDLALVAEICDYVYVMKDGRTVESGPTLDVFRNPEHPYTRELVANVMSLRHQPMMRSEETLEGRLP